MPGLVACGRRWDIGSDDFVFPGVAEEFVRGFWLIVIIIVFNVHNEFDCESGNLVRIFYIGTLVFLSAQILNNIVIVHYSMQGSITSVSKRRHVSSFLYIKAVLSVPEVIWLILGTFWAFDDATDCRTTVIVTVKAITVIGWLLILLFIIGLFLVFDPLGHYTRGATSCSNRSTASDGSLLTDSSNSLSDSVTPAARRLWENRCKVLCFCAACDEQSKNAFSDIAKIFSEFFEGLDLVPTDIAAGLILLETEQNQQPRKLVLHSLPRVPGPVPTYVNYNEISETRHSTIDAYHEDNSTSENNHTGLVTSNQPKGQNTGQNIGTNQLVTEDTLVNIEGATNFASRDPEQFSSVTLVSQPNSFNCDPAQTEVKQAITPEQLPHGETANAENGLDNKPFPRPAEWMTISNCTYYMRYALACYSWPMYMYMHPCVGCCHLSTQCRCCECTDTPDSIIDDNCCKCHLAAVQRIAGIDEEDLIYASFYNRVYEIPFYVVVDHNMCSVIVAIRGTLSLRDALTDLTAECETLDGISDVSGCAQAHRGILQAAKYIQKTLENKRILEKAFMRGEGYQLVITGHSLGAGAAALLSLLLRDQYPNLNCFSYSPPGGLLSKSLSRLTEDFVCSVVLGDDLVPRLGIVSMDTLKSNMLRCIRDSNKPKYRILAGGCWNALAGGSLQDGSASRGEEGEPPTDSASDGVHTHLLGPCSRTAARSYSDLGDSNAQEILNDAIRATSRRRISLTALYPPGHVLYIRETAPKRSWFGVGTFDAAWTRPDIFDEIIVSARMITHHLPDTVLAALEQLDERSHTPSHVVTKYQP